MKTAVLCGSMKHESTMMEITQKLENMGYLVHTPKLSNGERHNGKLSIDEKSRLMRSWFPHLEKADAVIIVNEDAKGIKGYIGANTFLEMSVAFYLQKPIYTWREVSPELPAYEEVIGMKPICLYGKLEAIS